MQAITINICEKSALHSCCNLTDSLTGRPLKQK